MNAIDEKTISTKLINKPREVSHFSVALLVHPPQQCQTVYLLIHNQTRKLLGFMQSCCHWQMTYDIRTSCRQHLHVIHMLSAHPKLALSCLIS